MTAVTVTARPHARTPQGPPPAKIVARAVSYKCLYSYLKGFSLSKLSMVNECWFAQVCTRFALGLHWVCTNQNGGLRENKTPVLEQTLSKPCANHEQTCANHVQTENKMVCSMQTEQTMSKHGTNPKRAHT